MPNIKSSEKRVEIAKKNNLRNRAKKSEISTIIKKFKKAVAEKDIVNAETFLAKISSLLDIAAKENIIHQNNASRKKAHFAKLLTNAKNA